ncbi:PstS family phosphate ABC transporter substrate-binding protein [Porticoccaceae bacterium]|nr:PstS family phosphate ABC transporter substrate-binding protein [Porticoccaceae bacterium]MDB2343240.1 PstS family phosphate ABC transporter substrate-binding protein [Porticoccaceae bacterium]MDB2634064.1 PstS family phosphate ABC transporter substrate-binding protein [Porticoccaceae bacterium]MDB2663899.1 PstS family phosphate ABC transporter substrate-binding protein [Porticoccaceae bacterium]
MSLARESIEVVGSSTVYPFSTVVAERYGRASGKPTPKIESTGSGGGMKLFCSGVGTNYPDITNASRRIKMSEFKKCQGNGVKDIIEVQIGYDGIVIANSVDTEPMNLTRKDIFLALAAKVPGAAEGELIDNPYSTWQQVNPELPDAGIEVLGPPPTSGTRDAFAELAMEGGCKKIAWIAALKKTDKNAFKQLCHTVREDGRYIEAGENDNLIVQKLEANPSALGVFGFSFLDQNADKVQGATIEDVMPTFESIADKTYPISRPLFFYVKKAHVGVVPGIKGFLNEFTSEKAWGEDGYLAEKGMIPLPTAERTEMAKNTRALKPMTGKEALK